MQEFSFRSNSKLKAGSSQAPWNFNEGQCLLRKKKKLVLMSPLEALV